jgi:hypothetical protein
MKAVASCEKSAAFHQFAQPTPHIVHAKYAKLCHCSVIGVYFFHVAFLFVRAFSSRSEDKLSGIYKVKKHNRRLTFDVFLEMLCKLQ